MMKLLRYVYENVLEPLGLVNTSSVVHLAMTCAGTALAIIFAYISYAVHSEAPAGQRVANVLKLSCSILIALCGLTLAGFGGAGLRNDFNVALFDEKSAAGAVSEQELNTPDTQ